MKKIIVIILSLIMLGNCMYGCDKKQQTVQPDVEIDYSVEKLQLVENNSTEYSIVYSSRESSAQYFACTELQNFIRESTGVEIPMITDEMLSYSENSKYISVGDTSILKSADLNFDYSKLNFDGFFIKRAGNLILIDGDNDRGVIYGVYDFLEKMVGVRFYAVDSIKVPKLEKLEIPGLNIVQAPAFEYRNYYGYTERSDKLYATRMRMSHEMVTMPEIYGGSTGWYDGFASSMHNTLEVVKPAMYYADHPEMFMVRNGAPVDICMSNGMNEDGTINDLPISTAKAFLDNMKQRVDSQPDAKFFMVGQMDLDKGCPCATCDARAKLYGGRSGSMIVFYNTMVNELNAYLAAKGENRKINIVMFAYMYSQYPPVLEDANGNFTPKSPKTIPSDNLFIRLAPIEQNFIYAFDDPRQTASQRKLFASWAAMTRNIMVWDYHLNHQEYFWYMPVTGTMRQNYTLYQKMGLDYVMTQSTYSEQNDFQADLRTYLASKLMWNPNQDVVALQEEYLDYHYGQAAPAVKELLKIMDEHFAILAKTVPDFEIRVSHTANQASADPSNYPIEMLRKCEKLIQDEITKAKESTTLSKEEKLVLEKKLVRVILTPQRMIMKGGIFYMNAREELENATRFFDNADFLGVVNYGEAQPIAKLKSLYF